MFCLLQFRAKVHSVYHPRYLFAFSPFLAQPVGNCNVSNAVQLKAQVQRAEQLQLASCLHVQGRVLCSRTMLEASIAADHNLGMLILKLFFSIPDYFEMLQIILKAIILEYADLIQVIKSYV